MSDIEDYIAAMVAREAAEKEVEALIERLRAYAEPLMEDWRECRDLVVGSPPVIKGFGKNVPAPDELQRTLIRFFEKEAATLDLWRRLSVDERRHLVSPDRDKSAEDEEEW